MRTARATATRTRSRARPAARRSTRTSSSSQPRRSSFLFPRIAHSPLVARELTHATLDLPPPAWHSFEPEVDELASTVIPGASIKDLSPDDDDDDDLVDVKDIALGKAKADKGKGKMVVKPEPMDEDDVKVPVKAEADDDDDGSDSEDEWKPDVGGSGRGGTRGVKDEVESDEDDMLDVKPALVGRRNKMAVLDSEDEDDDVKPVRLLLPSSLDLVLDL